jgi:cell division protein FtsI (penicillin-binding protein 3)
LLIGNLLIDITIMASSDNSNFRRRYSSNLSRRKISRFQKKRLRGELLRQENGEQNHKKRKEKNLNYRLFVVWAILMMGMLALGVKLFSLQVLQGEKLQEKAQQQQTARSRPFVPRRPIVDRNGNFLAVDRPVYTLYAHPFLFKITPTDVASQLAPVLEGANLEKTLSKSQLIAIFDERDSGLKIVESLSEETAKKITYLGIDGLELIQHQQRLYPQEKIAAEIVGYVDGERKGQAGVEYSQQNLLERLTPNLEFARSIHGILVPKQLATGYLQVDDLQLHLTIDTRLQRAARAALIPQIEKYKAKRGTVVVMDATDGALLALASVPSYNPNEYYKYGMETFKNWAVTDVYEPGSTFKPLNVAVALEVGAIEADSVFMDEGRIFVSGWPIANYDYERAGAKGYRSVTEIIKYSSNVGMVKIVQQMQPEVFYDGLKRLGLGETSGIDLPFETPSMMKTREQFLLAPVEAATTAFGQGFSLTPVQMARLHATLANGGKLVTPYVVRGLFDSKGQAYWQLSKPTPRQVFSPETTKEVLKMMEVTVDSGTGMAAKIPGYRIAGKTGTAQKASPFGGYSKNLRITSFVGIFPVEAPRYVVLAVIDEPSYGTGGLIAAPIVKSVIEAAIAIEKLPPADVREKMGNGELGMGNGE